MKIALAVVAAATLAACDGGSPAGGGDDAPAPHLLATSPANVVELALDADAIYWAAEDGQILYRLPRAGGGPQALFAAPERGWVEHLAVGETAVYYTFLAFDGSGASVRRVDRGGGTPETVASGFGPGELFSIAAFDGAVVYGTQRALWRVTAGGSEHVADVPGLPSGLTGAGAFIYTGTGASEGSSTVVRISLDGASQQVIASNLGYPSHIVIDGDTVYFTDYYRDRVHRVAATGGGDTALVDGDDACSALAKRGDRLYYTSRYGGEAIVRMLAPDAAPATIYRGDVVIGPIGDDGGVYWVDGRTSLFAL